MKNKCFLFFQGRYNLSLPTVTFSCGKTWDASISDRVETGFWPATVCFETLYTVDLLTTYEDLRMTVPGMSQQAFVSMLGQHTKLFSWVSTSLKQMSTSLT